MDFERLYLKEELSITRIITIHYFEYTSTYHFAGESHDFWEFLCVDKGEVIVRADQNSYTLTRGQMIFHRPGEFHTVTANGKIAPNLVVISFDCGSPCMKHFEHLITSISENEKSLLARIIHEAKQCIVTPLDDPYTCRMERNPQAPFGAEQLIKLYMEQLLITLLRRQGTALLPHPSVKSVKKKNDSLLMERVHTYLEEHLQDKLTLEEICRANLVGRAQLLKLFRDTHGCGVIDYFSNMKIEKAKQMIREDYYNFTQISDYLGYSTIHYFSRQFKKITGMTPSEYASSIKALSE